MQNEELCSVQVTEFLLYLLEAYGFPVQLWEGSLALGFENLNHIRLSEFLLSLGV